MYKVYLADKKVIKSLDHLSADVRERVKSQIMDLADSPKPSGVKPLKGKLKGVWRLRVGDYRVLYDVDDKKREVAILDIGHRREIYN